MTSWYPGGENRPGGPGPGGQGYGQQPYGGGPLEPYGGGPQDPYAGQAVPVPPYQPYPNPGSWEAAQYLPRPGVPGALIAGSILGYVLAAFVFVTGLLLVFFGSVVAGSFDSLDSSLGDGGTSLVIAGLGNWIAAALLITGWVLATMRRPIGLLLALAGSGMVLALAVYWVVLYPVSGIVAWAIIHVVLGAVPAGLALIPSHRTWMAAPSGPPRPVPPFPVDRYGRPFGT